ncbi:hypothetical protein HWV62_43636 [Athelia sp. TMB]|nr:hypothetical protein HWV62_43636 [Athelia sp. TMB]
MDYIGSMESVGLCPEPTRVCRVVAAVCPELPRRTPTYELCRDMDYEVDKLKNPKRSGKRPAELPAASLTRSVKARTEKTAPASDAYIDLSMSPAPEHTAPTTSPAPLASSPTPLARPAPSVPSAAAKARAGSVIELFEDDMEIGASRAAATKKSPWPLKYVVDMARGFNAQETMAGTIEDTFRAAFGMDPPKSRSTWAKHIKIWKNSTQAEREDFIAAERSRTGEWRVLMKQITPWLKGLKDEDDMEAIVLKVEDKPQAETPIILASPENSICFVCTERLPDVQSEKLLSLKQDVLSASRSRGKTGGTTKYIGALASYCLRHRTESALERRHPENRWPAYVDFTMLRPRVEACANQLRAIWLEPQESHFYITTMQQVSKLGMEGAFNAKNDFSASMVSTVGYFGEKGACIMFSVIQSLFPNVPAHGLRFVDFVRRVLLPETAVLLAQDDLAVSWEKAIDILLDSKEYGVVMYPEDDDEII